MSNNTTKPNTSKKTSKSKKSSGKKVISSKHISLPGGKELKMNFTRWVMLFTLIGLLIVVLVTYPNRAIRNDIKEFESKDEVVAYCVEKDLNCTFTVLADYDIEGYKVSRVAFLDDNFFGEANTASEATSGSESVEPAKQQKNVYITVQRGETIEVPE